MHVVVKLSTSAAVISLVDAAAYHDRGALQTWVDPVHSALCCKTWRGSLADLNECGKILCKVGVPLQPLLAPCGDVLRQLHSLDPAVLHLHVSRSGTQSLWKPRAPLQLLMGAL